MADIAINPVTRRVQFTGNTGLGPFAFTFNILQNTDIVVYKNRTLLTLTTDYTVSINANGTGSVTLTGSGSGTALVADDVFTLIGGRELSRTTDFVTAGDLLASSLNEQLDSNVIMSQQLDERFSRTIRVNPGDADKTLEVPSVAERADKILKFDSSGNIAVESASALFGGAVVGANFTNNTFTGNGSQTAFTTTVEAGSKNNAQVYIDGVYQLKSSFSVSANTLTFTEAPPLNSQIEVIIGNAIDNLDGDSGNVNYNQGGTGAQTRTVENKLQELVSVKDFGAIGNGVADDTAAIQAALDANSKVYFPEGTYLCSALTLNPYNYLIGSNRDNSSIKYSGSGDFLTGGANVDRLTLENLTITSSGSPTGWALFLDSSTSRTPRIVNCAFTTFKKGIRIDDALHGHIEQVYIGGQGSGVSGGIGLQLGESALQAGTTWSINGVYINSFETGIVSWASSSSITNAIIENAVTGIQSNAAITIIDPWFSVVTTEFDVNNNGICIMSPRWHNTTPQISYGSSDIRSRTTIIPSAGDLSPANGPSWKFSDFSIYRDGKIQHDTGQLEIVPTFDYSISATADYTFGVERSTTAGQGHDLTIQSGGVLSGETNTDAGDLYLKSGIATGSGRSSIYSYYTGGGGSGTSDQSPALGTIVHHTGAFLPGSDNAKGLGSASLRWSEVFAGTGTINTSDQRKKQNIETLSDAERNVALAAKGLLRKFKFTDAVQRKGDAARIHFGIIAQDLKAAFEAEGLNAFDYGVLCYDEYEGETLSDGTVLSESGNVYGVRYNELFAFVLSAI